MENQQEKYGEIMLIWKFQNKLDLLVDNEYNDIPIKFERYSEATIQLLEDMLTWDPEKRITAEEAILSDFFNEPPFPIENRKMSFLKDL